MKKSKLSVFSLMCGITATAFSILLVPVVFTARSETAVMLLGFLCVSSIVAGVIGTVSAIVKLLITDNKIVQDQEDRIIAKKGLWFSAIPAAIMIIILLLGST